MTESYIGPDVPAPGSTQDESYCTASAGQTTFSATYVPGFVDIYVNGLKLRPVIDFTAINGSTVILDSAATLGDIVGIISVTASDYYNTYTKVQSDARYAKYHGVATGSGNAMSVAMTPSLSSLSDGLELVIRVPAANTVVSPTVTFTDLG